MKTLITALLVIGSIFAATAQTGIITTNLPAGITWVAAGATSNAISTALIEVRNHEEIAVQWRAVFSSTNAAGINTVSLNLGASEVPSNLVSIATITRPVPSTTATLTQDFGTNVYIGSFRYFGIIGFTSGATNSTVTNSVGGTLGSFGIQTKANRDGID